MIDRYAPFHSASSKVLAFLLLTSGAGISLNGSGPRLPSVEGCASQEQFIAERDAAPSGAPMVASDFVVSVGFTPTLNYTINGTPNLAFTLTRGQSYTFDLTAVSGGHPFVINSSASTAGGTIYAGPSSGTVITFTPDNVMPATIYYHCMVHFTLMHATITLVSPPKVAVKAFLEGPFNSGTLLMGDAVRAAGLLPSTEPYTDLGYPHAGGGGGESVDPAVFDVTGNNAIVDWVVVEMRDNLLPTTVVATHSALIQCDGDVVGLDGTSPVQFTLALGTYKVALRHRNHLGVMTLNGATFTGSVTPSTIDLTVAATACFGTNARNTVGSTLVLWMGDSSFDGVVQYTGANNDRDPILVSIGGTVPTNTVSAYLNTDLNLDGQAQYTGSNNDRDPILVNIGGTVPTNTRVAQLP